MAFSFQPYVLLAALFAGQLAAASSGLAADGERPVIMLEFKRADATPEGSAQALLERLRNAAEWAVPKERGSAPFLCKVEFVKDKDAKRFSSCTVKGREIHVAIGGPLETLPYDMEALSKLVATLLLARCEMPAEQLDSGFPDWLAVGLARKVSADYRMAGVPGSSVHPGAIALAAAGVYPSLRSVVESRLEPSDGACYSLYAEYAQILVVACGRAGMPQAGVFRSLVSDASKKGSSRYTSFIGAASAVLAMQGARAAEANGGTPQQAKLPAEGRALAVDVFSWYDIELKRSIQNCFSPLPARRIEALFKDASKLAFKDKENAEHVCEIDELCSKWGLIANQGLAAAELRMRLSELANVAPDDVKDALWRLETAVNSIIAAGAKPEPEALAPALKDFYDALEARIALEAELKRFERANTTPGDRFNGELRAIAALNAWEEEPFAKEAAFLDNFLAKAAKSEGAAAK